MIHIFMKFLAYFLYECSWWMFVIANFALLFSTGFVLIIEEYFNPQLHPTVIQSSIFYRVWWTLFIFGGIIVLSIKLPMQAMIVSILIFDHFLLDQIVDGVV